QHPLERVVEPPEDDRHGGHQQHGQDAGGVGDDERAEPRAGVPLEAHPADFAGRLHSPQPAVETALAAVRADAPYRPEHRPRVAWTAPGSGSPAVHDRHLRGTGAAALAPKAGTVATTLSRWWRRRAAGSAPRSAA